MKKPPGLLPEASVLRAGGTSDQTSLTLSDTVRRSIVIFAEEITSKSDALSRTDVESAQAIEKLAGAIVDVCEGRCAPGASAASAGPVRSLMKEKDAALTALENMTRAFRLATLERDSQATLAATYVAQIEGLKTERTVLHAVISPMPPQTLIERAEELVCQVRGVRSLVSEYEERLAGGERQTATAMMERDAARGLLDGCGCGMRDCANAPAPGSWCGKDLSTEPDGHGGTIELGNDSQAVHS